MTCTQCGTLNDATARECKRCHRPLQSLAAQGKIPCYIHSNREATSTCAVSGFRICSQCTVTHNGIDYAAEFAPAEAQRVTDDLKAIPVLETNVAAVATFGRRAAAWLIDAAVILGVVLVLYGIIELFTGFRTNILVDSKNEPVGFWLLRIVGVLGALAYATFMTALDGQTLGKRAMGIMVLRPDGHPLDFQTAAVRSAASLLSLIPLGLGFFWALWDIQKQTWHDKISETAVYDWSDRA